jgi:hypothetical protein
MRPITLTKVWRMVLAMLFILVTTGCSTIKLVGDYDEEIDKGATALHKAVETHFVKLAGTAKKDDDPVDTIDKYKQFYLDSKVATAALRIRADATERNSLTVRMIDKIITNLGRLEEMHTEGIKRGELPPLKGGLTTQFTALLTFELAKKRGEKPDEAKSKAPATPNTDTEGAKK